MKTSYEELGNIFYLSQLGKRRFGLKRWRESEEKTALSEAIRELDEFTTTEVREIFESIVGPGRVNDLYQNITELIEDGEIERVGIGHYRKKT